MPPPGQTQLPDWDGLKLRVRTLIASHRVMIFSKSYCPYCNKVRRRRPESPRRAPPPALSSARQPPERGLSEPLPPPRRRGGGGGGGRGRPGAAPVRGERHLPAGRPLAGLAARPAPRGGSAQGEGGWKGNVAGTLLLLTAPSGFARYRSSSVSIPLKLSTRCRPLPGAK